MRFISKLPYCLLLLMGLFWQQSITACSCIGPYDVDFCGNVDTAYHHVGFVVLIDSIDYPLRRAVVVHNVNPSKPFLTDTIIVVGADGVNCNADLTGFKLGDTTLMALYYGDYVAQTEPGEYYHLDGCDLHYIKMQNNLLEIPLADTLAYEEFLADPLSCLTREPMIDTGTEDFTPIEASITLAPNPTMDGRINITSSSETAILGVTFFDAHGRRIRAVNNGQQSYQLGALPSGLYFVRVQTERGVVTKRLMMQ